MTVTQIAGKMTPHQRWALGMLVSRSTSNRELGGWVLATETGAPAAMERLVRRGLVERKVEIGPRGGEHVCYRPTRDGIAVRDYIVGHDLKRY